MNKGQKQVVPREASWLLDEGRDQVAFPCVRHCFYNSEHLLSTYYRPSTMARASACVLSFDLITVHLTDADTWVR